MKIVLTGGGTAGHVVPLLAVAEALKGKGQIFYLGGGGELEKKLLGDQPIIEYLTIPTGPLHRFFSFSTFSNFFKSVLGFWVALFKLLKIRPKIIFAKGGYVSLPVALAGRLLRIRLIIHESDSVLGLANRILSKFTQKILVGFPMEVYSGNTSKFVYVGNPLPKIFQEAVRLSQEEKKKIFEKWKLDFDQKLVLVLGGGQGAHTLNQLVIRNIESCLKTAQIVLISGSRDFKEARNTKFNLVSPFKNRFLVFDFLEKELPEFLAIADLVVSRAGAGAISAISFFGKPSIFIPYPYGAQNHQLLNAQILEGEKACKLILEKDLTPENFLVKIKELFQNQNLLQNFQKNVKKFAVPDSAQKIAKIIIESI